MDPAQLKASYDQTQFLTEQISKLDRDLLKTQNQQTDTILNSQERAGYANENRSNRNQQQIIDNMNDKSARILSTVERTGTDGVLATERTASMIDTNQYRIAGQMDNSIYRTTGDINANLYRTTAALDNNLSKVGSDTLQAVSAAHQSLDNDLYRVAGNIDNSLYRAQSAIQTGQAAMQLESQKSVNEIIGYMTRNNDLNWKHYADQQVTALNNKDDLTKQMAFQYSDLKSSILTSESNIKDVLRTQESERLRDALRATEHKSLYFELKGHDHHHHRRRR